MSLIRVRDKDGNYIDIPALQGESAYDIAVRNGFVGTEQEWLESMGFANYVVLNKLGDSNGNLTYDGKVVGGDARAVIEETFTEEYGDFAFVLTASDTYPVKNAVLTVASASITENTEIKSVKILFSGKTDYIDVKDIPMKHNTYYEPCIVSAFHPVADDGSESLVVGFKVASLYFPVDCKAYTDIRNGNYSAVKVEYYGG